MLQQKNGLKTTQSVVKKQQSGVDAQQKVASAEAPTFTQQQLDTAGKKIDAQNTAVPQDAAGQQARQKTIAQANAVANNVDVNQGVPPEESDKTEIPIVKKEAAEPKQMSYVDMFKAINGDKDETDAQKARREKRERRNARIAALGDGLRALSNMFFATQGAKVVHNPQSDMTATMAKRKALLDEQREKNKAAWLNGYLKAQALDEEAKKNRLTLAEQMRYHDMIAENNKDKNNLSQQRIDLSRYRINSLNDYNAKKLQIDKDYKDGLLTEKSRANAIAQLNADANMLRARKSGNGRGGSSSSSRKNSYSGNVAEYIDLKEKDPKGMAAAEDEAREMGYSPKTASGKAAVREIYKRRHAKGGGNAKPKPKPQTQTQSKGGGGGKPAASGKKKSTGVKW